jgi:hypothetical protein
MSHAVRGTKAKPKGKKRAAGPAPSATKQTRGATDRGVKSDLNRDLLEMLRETGKTPWAAPFRVPVTEAEYPSYYEVIESPMCLEQMRVKCQQGIYTRGAEFLDDAGQIVTNSTLFNGEAHRVTQQARYVMEKLKAMWTDVESRHAASAQAQPQPPPDFPLELPETREGLLATSRKLDTELADLRKKAQWNRVLLQEHARLENEVRKLKDRKAELLVVAKELRRKRNSLGAPES